MPSVPARHSLVASAASRVVASAVGGWIFVWGFVTLGIELLLLTGMDFKDARTLVYLLAFPVFLSMMCWSFAAATAMRAWAVLLAGGSAMTGLAWFLSR